MMAEPFIPDHRYGDCGEYAEEPHTCPFSEEIHDDYESTCTCCRECAHQCAMDI